MDLGIDGRKAIVAGGSSGLGLATARSLARAGARVAICGRDPDRLAEARGQIDGDPIAITADLSTPEGARRFVEQAREELDGLHILVTNAGGPKPGTFSETEVSDYPDALALNLLSVVAMCHAALPTLRAQRWGRVLAITSIAVRQPIPNLILSNTARAGATGFLKTVAREVAAEGVTVNSILPGLHRTQRLERLFGDDLPAATAAVPAGVLGEPADFGDVAAFLCSEAARFITGAAIPVDGGADAALL